jgi:mono/diheme cytochrome c family protein
MILSGVRLPATIVVLAMAIPVRGQTPPSFTAAQAADGLAAYQTNCATCHLPDLSGRAGTVDRGVQAVEEGERGDHEDGQTDTSTKAKKAAVLTQHAR